MKQIISTNKLYKIGLALNQKIILFWIAVKPTSNSNSKMKYKISKTFKTQ